MQIDRLSLRATDPDLCGASAGVVGVVHPEPDGGRVPLLRRGMLVVVLAALSLLGQGERSRVDPRFISPSATLRTYWEAMRTGDANGAWECMVEGRHQLPRPGMLWFLPATDELTLAEFRSLPVTGGRIIVSYEVRYRPKGSGELHSFRSADELVRMRGEWRIARPIGDVSMPAWRDTPRSVDI